MHCMSLVCLYIFICLPLVWHYWVSVSFWYMLMNWIEYLQFYQNSNKSIIIISATCIPWIWIFLNASHSFFSSTEFCQFSAHCTNMFRNNIFFQQLIASRNCTLVIYISNWNHPPLIEVPLSAPDLSLLLF